MKIDQEQEQQQQLQQEQEQQTTATPPPLPPEVRSPKAPEAEDLEKRVNTLSRELENLRKEKTRETRAAELEKIIAPLPDKLKKIYRRSSFGGLDEKGFKAFKDEVAEEVKELVAEEKQHGAVMSRPKEAGKADPESPTDKEIKAVLKRLNL